MTDKKLFILILFRNIHNSETFENLNFYMEVEPSALTQPTLLFGKMKSIFIYINFSRLSKFISTPLQNFESFSVLIPNYRPSNNKE